MLLAGGPATYSQCKLILRILWITSPLTNGVFCVILYLMKTRNIINSNNEDSSEPFAVAQHIILSNRWEYYLEEEDSYGLAFGFVMGMVNEWGMVDMAELRPHIVSSAKGAALDEIMPPVGYYWEDEKEIEKVLG